MVVEERVSQWYQFGKQNVTMEDLRGQGPRMLRISKNEKSRTNKINIEIRRSTTPGKRVILVQGPC